MEQKKYYPKLIDATIEDLAKHFNHLSVDINFIDEVFDIHISAGKFSIEKKTNSVFNVNNSISDMCAVLINKLEIPAFYYECKAKYSIPLMNSVAQIFEIKVGRNDGEFMYFAVADKGVAYELNNHIEVYEATQNCHEPLPPQQTSDEIPPWTLP